VHTVVCSLNFEQHIFISVMVDVKDYGDISFVSEGTARINGTKVVKTNLPKYKSEHSSRVRKAKNSEEVAAAAKAVRPKLD